jgi:hypothetical protein
MVAKDELEEDLWLDFLGSPLLFQFLDDAASFNGSHFFGICFLFLGFFVEQLSDWLI